MPRRAVGEIINLCHEHEVLVSTGGFLEQVLMQGKDAVKSYIRECKELGFDTIEISSGFITLPADDWLRLVEQVQKAGLKAKPEVGIQFGAGGATREVELETEGTRDPEWPIRLAQRRTLARNCANMVTYHTGFATAAHSVARRPDWWPCRQMIFAATFAAKGD